MKRIMLVGSIGCGKTTFCQAINGLDLKYKKTQAIEIINSVIDTPGEYLEHRSFLQALVVTSVEVDVVIFMQDPLQQRNMFSPGMAAAFPVPVIGVISKTDSATADEIDQAFQLLTLAGAHPIFKVSSITNQGLKDFIAYLKTTAEAV